jgi:hypothetical protein
MQESFVSWKLYCELHRELRLGQPRASEATGAQLLKLNVALAHMYPKRVLRAPTNANSFPAEVKENLRPS